MADVKIFTLSTCGHCKKTKAFLKDCGQDFDFVDVDKLTGDERKKVIEEVKECNPKLSFPTLKIGETVIVGFKEEEIKKALGI